MRDLVIIQTHKREQLIDITEQVNAILQAIGTQNGLVNVYAQGATATILVQKNRGCHAGRICSSASLTAPGNKERLS